MQQVTLRLEEGLASRLRMVAAERGESVNGYAQAVLRAAVDPDLAGSEIERLRERLSRAGLLAVPVPASHSQPPEDELREARAAAGSGTSLADLVIEDRR